MIRQISERAGVTNEDELGGEYLGSRDFLRTSMSSIVFPVERSSLTVLDMLDSRYMAPGGQLHGRQMEAQFRKLEQECRSLQSMLIRATDLKSDASREVEGGGAAPQKRDVLRPLHVPSSPRFPARRDASSASKPRTAGVFGGGSPTSSRPGSTQGRMLKTSRSAAAALGYYADDQVGRLHEIGRARAAEPSAADPDRQPRRPLAPPSAAPLAVEAVVR